MNAIPHGFGLGSSAAAIVAGVLAARALSGEAGAERLPDEAVLRLAADIEGHADNVAACLAGGLTIAWDGGTARRAGRRPGLDGPSITENRNGWSIHTRAPAGTAAGLGSSGPAAGLGSVRCLRLEPLPGLTPVLCVPAVPLATEAARQVLPATVPHADAARNAARSALLLAALTQPGLLPDAGVLLDATLDFLHQPYRASSMPATAELIGSLRTAGIPAVVSGAGPAALALVVPGITPPPDAVAAIAARAAQDWAVRVLEVDRHGAVVAL